MDISALTLDILNNAKRYHTTVSFLADTGIKEASNNDSRVAGSNFRTHLQKAKSVICIWIIPHSPRFIASTAAVCQTWDEQIKDLTAVARDLTRKQNQKSYTN
ncbi:hypothetical protein BY996DRAFT_6420754 [Phakopsora pachyrhizi]|nr:hypothetical protein BY996DRAFT_6420754 [Phakopsora pachyrhizi]